MWRKTKQKWRCQPLPFFMERLASVPTTKANVERVHIRANLDSLTHSISKALHDIRPANKLHLHRTWVRSLTSMILQPVSSEPGDQRLEVIQHNRCGASFKPFLIVFANGCFVYWTHQYCTLFHSLIGFTPEVVCSLETSWLLLPAHCLWIYDIRGQLCYLLESRNPPRSLGNSGVGFDYLWARGLCCWVFFSFLG